MKALILSGGKADQSICQVYGNIPTALIPIYGKPIIYYILKNIIDLGISEVYIAIGFQHEKVKSYIENYLKYTTKANIHFVIIDEIKKPGISLYNTLKVIKKGKVFISLADTICDFDNNILEKGDFILASKKFDKSDLWCTVTKDGDNKLLKIRDKEKNLSKNELALTGIYVLNDVSVINNLSEDTIPSDFEISYLLDKYNSVNKIEVIESKNWLDFGHIEKYQKSKKRLLEARSFNTLSFNDTFGTITKKSTYTEKFIAEIQWLLNLPKSLKVLSPRVLDYSLNDKESFVTMEYYSYQTVTEIWLYANFSVKTYKGIIDKVLSILSLFKDEKREVSKYDYKAVYITKTHQRLKLIKEQNCMNLNKMLAGNRDGFIYINNKKLKSWQLLEKDIFHKIEELYNVDDNCLIHGDYCFSNLLYDINSGVLRLIDPRGVWGASANGDFKYDLAKLRHSVVGDYDFIVNDLFSIEILEASFNYTIKNNETQLKIKNYFDKKVSQNHNLNHIKLIEGLLFLTMVPLHSNSEDRQIVMLAKAIEKLNNIS
jgi:dTDP-glucose pyrophosphorylase